jgi:hypothetical protein
VLDKHIGWKDLGSFLFVMVFLGINIALDLHHWCGIYENLIILWYRLASILPVMPTGPGAL